MKFSGLKSGKGILSKCLKVFCLVVAIVAGMFGDAWSADYTSYNNGNWNSGGTWSRWGFGWNTPGENDNVTIRNNIIVNTSTSINNLTLSSGTLTVNQNLTSNGNFIINGGSINITANLILNGTLTINTEFEINEKYDLRGVTKIEVTPGSTLTINSSPTLNQNITLSGNIIVTSGNTLTLGGSQVDFSGASFDGSEGTISISSNPTIKNLTNCVGGNLAINPSSTITYDASCTYMLPGEYNNVTLNTAAGSDITLCDNVTINGILRWNNASRIALNGHTMALCKLPTGNTSYNEGHMFIAGGNGALKFFNPTAATITTPITMHVGTHNETAGYEYSPVSFTSNVSFPTGSYAMVQVMDTALSGKATDIARYWTITTSGLTVSDATIRFNYDENDDHFDYADQWTVYKDDIEISESNTTIGGYAIEITGLSDIAGVWTAKGPEAETYYTHRSGAWNDPNTWTTDPTGKTVVNPRTPTGLNDVVILNGKTVYANNTIMEANTVKICDGGTLDMEDLASSHNFQILYGQGTLKINGDFPVNGNYSLFVSPDGGTTEFVGSHGDSPIPSQYTYNNLILNYDSNVRRSLNQNLKINGNLTLTNGSLVFRATNQSITVNGDIKVETHGGIYVYREGNTTHADTIVVGGNFENRGTVSMTYRNYNDYNQAQATSDEGTDGRGIIRFVKSKDAYFRCYSTTNMSQLIVDKGSDQTYRVTVYSDTYDHFGVLGRANQAGAGYNNQDNPPQILKPLWIRNGTLELTGNVHFKSLTEGGGDNFFIPLNGCLHLNGENVKVEICFGGNSNKALMPSGKLLIDAGLLDCKTGGGAIFRNTSEVVINGGKLRGSQFRPSQIVNGGKTTFIMNGGEAVFDGQGEMKSDNGANYSTFYMPFNTYTFIMTGGNLNIYSATDDNGGAFVVNCNTENSKITGGEITIHTKEAQNQNGTDYIIISSIPLYNLTLRNDDNFNYTHSYKDFSGSVNNRPVTVTSDKLYVTNNLTIGNHVTFNTNNKGIEVGGNLIIESGSTINLGTSNVMLNGGGRSIQQFTVDGTIHNGANNNVDGYYSLTIDDHSDIQVNSSVIVNNLFTLGEDAIMRDGAANTYTLKGNAVISGTHFKPASGAGTIVFAGAAPTISGTGNGVLNNVNVNLSSGNLSLDANLGITGDLRLISSSLFNIAGHLLALGEEAAVYSDAATSTNFSSAKMIMTNGVASASGVSKKYNSSNKSFTFPFGLQHNTDCYYLPATINYTQADAYGTVTSHPVYGVHPLMGNASASLGCYWITEETDFSGVSASDIGQTYNYNASFINGDATNYVPARYHNAEWTKLGTGSMHPAGNYFDYNSAQSASGHYTCGDPATSFADIQKFYSSSFVTANGNTGAWEDPRSWSIDSVGGVPNYYNGSKYFKYVAADNQYKEYNHSTGELIESGEVIGDFSGLPYPTVSTAVYIGSDHFEHTITMGQNGNSCASLRIHPGSTLDLGIYTGHSFSLVEVDETAEEGAGTLKISSTTTPAHFPSGDFVKFLGKNGGTVHYYGNHISYYIPSTSESGLSLKNYCNLIIGGSTHSYRIRIPLDIDLTIYKDLTASGHMHTAYTSASHTITIYGNFDIKPNSDVYTCEAGYNRAQNFIIYGDVNVAAGGTWRTSGHSTTTHSIKIQGNLNVDGTFNTYSTDDPQGPFKAATTFFGTDTSYITGSGTVRFYTLTCDKGTNATPMLIMQNNAISAHDNDEPFLTLKNGTFQVDIGNGNTLELTRQCDLTIETTAALSVKSGTVNVANYNDHYNLILNGSLEVLGGVLNIGNNSRNTTNSIIYSPTSTPRITVCGGQLNVNGLIRRSNGTRSGRLSYRQSGGDVLICGKNRTNLTHTPDGNALLEILNDDSEFTMSGGTITTMAGEGSETYGDILIRPATTSCTGGNIIINGNSDQKILSSATLHNITVKAGSSLTVYSNPINAYSIIIEENAAFKSNGYDLTIRHSISNSNSNATRGVNVGGLQVGSTTQTTHFTSSNMEIEGVENNKTNFANVIIGGTLNLKNSTSDIIVNKNLTLTSGTVNDNGSTISLLGNLENYGTFTSSESTGGISFDGTEEEQYIIGIGTGILGSVIVNNPHKVYLNSNTRIENKLTLNSIFYADVNLLTLGLNATVSAPSFDSEHMILLNGAQEDNGVRKIFPSEAIDFTFPIGITANYTPARYQFASNTKSGASITVKPINYLNQDISIAPTCYLDFYWNVKTEGFDEDDDTDDAENPYFEVTQTYTYTDSKFVTTDGENYLESQMLPEYLRTVIDYRWLDERDNGATVDPDANTITFPSFGHIEGEYTAGVVVDRIYTALPILYSKNDGNWDEGTTWMTSPNGCFDSDLCTGDGENAHYKFTPMGNPVVIQAGNEVTVRNNETKSYCLTFADDSSKLTIGTTSGNDFGRVYGTGIMKMDATNSNDYMFPGGDFREFLNNPASTIEFGGNNWGVLPTSPGSPSHPLQNVILSGSGTKYLPAGTAEQINGSLTIESGTVLNNSRNNLHIIIEGDWIDKNTSSSGFVASNSEVTFAGDSTQNIKLSNNATTFYNLVISNTNGDSVIVTNGNYGFNVSNKLTLTKGYVFTDNDHLLVLSQTTTSYSGGSSNSFVDGPMGRQINSNGNANFPIGNNGRYALTHVSNVSSAGVWVAKYFNTDPNGAGYLTDREHLVDPLTNVSDNEYWEFYHKTNAAATATVNLRYDANSFPQVNTNSKLAKLTIVNFTDGSWNKVASTKTGSSVISGGNLLSSAAQTVSGKKYSFGYIGTTAQIDVSETSEYYVCDGTNTVSIPIVLTGTAPYTVQYRIANGGETTTNTISPITSDNYNITLSGTNLGGYNANSYTISIVGVSDASEDGIVSGDDVTVRVWYNAVPVITGDEAVGQTDTRAYTMDHDSDWENSYAWSWSGGANGASSVTFSAPTAAETNITFKRNGSNYYATSNGDYTLTATKTYITTNPSVYCSASATIPVNVTDHPVPNIISDTDDGSFTACYGTTHTYHTTYVSGHSYAWSVTGGTIIPGENANECQVTWNNSGSGSISVTETNNANGSHETDSENMYFYPTASISDDDVTTSDVCYETRGTVIITSTSSSLQYMVYNSDNGTIYSNYQEGNGSSLSINTTNLTDDVNIKVIAKNDGCSATSSAKTITVLETPKINITSISDLYIGAPAQIAYTQTSTVDPDQYSFNFANDDYDDISETNIGSPISIDIPTNATSLEGTLRVVEYTSGKQCFTDYSINETVSQDYLWSGAQSTAWNDEDNWYSNAVPNNEHDAIIRTATRQPIISTNDAKSKSVKIESGVLTISGSNTLEVYGDWQNAVGNDGFVGNTSTVAFKNDAEISGNTTFGSISIVTGKALNISSGHITINGDIANNGTLSGDEGTTLEIAGSTDAELSAGTFNLANLTINKTDDSKVLSAVDLNVSGNFTISEGILEMGIGKKINLGVNATATSGGPTAFVDGTMTKLGSSAITFPIGNRTRRAMVRIEPSGADESTMFTAKYTYTPKEEVESPAEPPAKVDGLKRVSSMDRWDITGESSSYITLYWDNGTISEIDDPSTLVVAHWNTLTNQWEMFEADAVAGTTPASGGIRTRGLVSSYSPYAFGATNDGVNPLPVELVSFTGRQNGNVVVLEWATLSEKDNDYFEIERSVDGINFVTIGFVQGAGNSTEKLAYSFADNAPERGLVYYRLSQVDYDGTRSFADRLISVVYTTDGNISLTVVPNPTRGQFSVRITGATDGIAKLLTQSGKQIRIVDIRNITESIDISDLPNGIYILQYQSGENVVHERVVKL